MKDYVHIDVCFSSVLYLSTEVFTYMHTRDRCALPFIDVNYVTENVIPIQEHLKQNSFGLRTFQHPLVLLISTAFGFNMNKCTCMHV